MRAEYSLILDEPAPCDDCQRAELCRFTGSACRAFSAYINGESWQSLPRDPSVEKGKRLGLQAAEMTDADRERLLATVAWG